MEPSAHSQDSGRQKNVSSTESRGLLQIHICLDNFVAQPFLLPYMPLRLRRALAAGGAALVDAGLKHPPEALLHVDGVALHHRVEVDVQTLRT